MNIHEYQARKLFGWFNVATPKGAPAETPEEAERVAAGLNTSNLVVKAQIHAGGRGKGTFTNGFMGGVKLCTTPAEARELAEKMLGQTLVTHQTGTTGKLFVGLGSASGKISPALLVQSDNFSVTNSVTGSNPPERAGSGATSTATSTRGVNRVNKCENFPSFVFCRAVSVSESRARRLRRSPR
jgi:hypothetical protein